MPSGLGDLQDAQAHLVGGALTTDDVTVGLALERGVRRTYGKDPLFGLLFTFGAALALIIFALNFFLTRRGGSKD